MEYKISKEIPAIYPQLREWFGPAVDWDKGIVIAYDDTIYAKDDMPQSLIVHEVVHLKQQAKVGVKKWWARYYAEPKFRLEQELEAFRSQVEYIKNDPNSTRADYRSMVSWLAKQLSSSIYGNIISYKDALCAIKA